MQVIAEGVETEKQMLFLMENHCDAMQGFLFSRPLSMDEFVTLLERESTTSDKFSTLRQLCPSFSDQSSLQFVANLTDS
jgi:predicted signal transduction protein with EAL and GGDEF domain